MDRGHIAHGRAPYIIKHSSGGVTIESYLDVMREVVNAYLSSMRPDEPARLASTSIGQA